MALTAEQQAEIQLEVDKQVFRLNAEAAADVYTKEQAREQARELARREHEIAMDQRRAKLEAVRLAKETLLENDRNKPTGERGIMAADITAFADTLIDYINN